LSVLTPRPPGPPRPDEPLDVEALEALIEEARRRARRRRRLYGACALLVASAGLLAYFGFFGEATAPEVVLEEPTAAPSAPPQQRVEPAAGIEGGSISALAVDANDNVFASGLDAGVFKSEDRGRDWRPLTIPSSVTRVDTLAIAPSDPQTVYLGTGSGVFKSTDGGATWQAANGDLFEGESTGGRDHRLLEGYVYSLVIDPRDPETVYAGTWGWPGILKTTNGGASWQRLGPGAVGALVLDPNDPDTLYVGSVGAAVGGGRAVSGVSTSTDGGKTWQPLGLEGTNVNALAVDPGDAETLYAGTAHGLRKSSDHGNTWEAGGLKEGVYGLTIDPQQPTTLYAVTAAGIFQSADGARTWRALDAGREGRDVNALALDPRTSSTVYAATEAGVLKSTDAGRSWKISTSGMAATRVEDLAAPTRHSAYALAVGRGFFTRSRAGWQAANTGLPTLDLSALTVDPQTPKTVYVVGGGTEIFKTTNRGESWQKLQAPSTSETSEISALAVDPEDANNLYAGTNEWGDYAGYRTGVFKSMDGGATWRALRTDGFLSSEIPALAIDPLNSQNVYVASSGVFRSSDGGADWESPVEDFIVRAFVLDPSKPETMYAGTDGEIFKSTNAGATWRALDVGFGTGSVNALAVNPHVRKTVYAGGDEGLFISMDGGDTWRRYRGDVGKRGIEALAVDPTGHILYVGGTGSGVVEVSLTGR
jgi:photosystem II stability/assembly factor-like uncharacterized protein